MRMGLTVAAMAATEREEQIRRERGEALVRTLHSSELRAAGAARAVALHEADVQLDRIAQRLPQALAAGVSIAEAARLAGVSRPTIYELRGRYSADDGDLRFALVCAIARLQPVAERELHGVMGRAPKDVSGVLGGLEVDCLAEWDVDDEGDGPDKFWNLTHKGFEWLEAWQWHELESEEGEP